MVTTFDPQCWSLAEHFLQDEPCTRDPELHQLCCHELALSIQQAVDTWFHVNDDVMAMAMREQTKC